METKFNFKSQIGTNRSQSERLLSLGLKRETADMCWTIDGGDNIVIRLIDEVVEYIEPAWSLHRLMALNKECCIEFINETAIDNAYDVMIDEIELAIKNRQFNNAYLE